MPTVINDFREARNIVGNIDVDTGNIYPPDNLAIALCTYFEKHPDRPENDPGTDDGWGEWVEYQVDKVLGTIVRTLRPDL